MLSTGVAMIPRNYKQSILILTLLFTMFWYVPAYAIRVAVFPVDDLSLLSNSINQEMTQFLVREISKKGLDVIDHQTILDFMTQRHVRQLGYLETKVIMSAREAIGADWIVLSSLCQKSADPSAIGVSIQLIRTSDGRTIWANTSALSRGSEQKILGVDAPESVEDLQLILAETLFSGWPTALDLTAAHALAGAQIAAVKETSYLEVDSVFFAPKVVRPGQKVECTIRFKSQDEYENTPKVFIKVGSRVYLASSDDGVFYNAAWVGSGEKPGTNVQVAMAGSDAAVLNQVWNGDVNDADYPVSLILDWPSGKRDESYLGTYVVDSRPPDVFFRLSGKSIDGMVSFRKELPIAVRFERSEPIKKWEFEIVDEKGDSVLRERGSMMPPDFKWRGQNGKNFRADSGIYQICLKVWDMAGNIGIAQEKVRLLDKQPDVAVSVEKRDGDDIIASLTAKDRVPVASWRLELWSKDNQLLKTYRGSSLPVEFPLPLFDHSIVQQGIACVLKVTDGLGSKSFTKSENFLSQLIGDSQDTSDIIDHSLKSDEWFADF